MSAISLCGVEQIDEGNLVLGRDVLESRRVQLQAAVVLLRIGKGTAHLLMRDRPDEEELASRRLAVVGLTRVMLEQELQVLGEVLQFLRAGEAIRHAEAHDEDIGLGLRQVLGIGPKLIAGWRRGCPPSCRP